MNNLVLLTSELIPIYQDENGNKLVDGRDLHEFLEIGKDFTTWIKDRIAKYGFVDNEDYSVTLTKTGERSNVIKHEYTLTSDMAKELSMVENNVKGNQARKYFIEVEKKFKQIVSDPYRGLSKELQAVFVLDKKTQEIESRVDKLENTMTIDYSQQEEIRTKATQRVVQVLGGKDVPAYKELNKKAFSEMWRDYKRALDVNSYRNTAVKDFNKGLGFVANWKPNRELELMIAGANSQIRI